MHTKCVFVRVDVVVVESIEPGFAQHWATASGCIFVILQLDWHPPLKTCVVPASPAASAASCELNRRFPKPYAMSNPMQCSSSLHSCCRLALSCVCCILPGAFLESGPRHQPMPKYEYSLAGAARARVKVTSEGEREGECGRGRVGSWCRH